MKTLENYKVEKKNKKKKTQKCRFRCGLSFQFAGFRSGLSFGFRFGEFELLICGISMWSEVWLSVWWIILEMWLSISMWSEFRFGGFWCGVNFRFRIGDESSRRLKLGFQTKWKRAEPTAIRVSRLWYHLPIIFRHVDLRSKPDVP